MTWELVVIKKSIVDREVDLYCYECSYCKTRIVTRGIKHKRKRHDLIECEIRMVENIMTL